MSGVGWGWPPGAVLVAALPGFFDYRHDPTLLDELRRVLSYPKLQAGIGDADELIKLLALHALGPRRWIRTSRRPGWRECHAVHPLDLWAESELKAVFDILNPGRAEDDG